jgi:hypothetical protein
MSNVTPESTTVALAGEVPLENKVAADLPGAFPETPGTEPASFSVNPIPASEGLGNPIKLAPGEPVPDPSTLTSNTVESTVHDDLTLANTADDSQQKFSVNPIPATAGGGNPIKLAPGEKVPDPSEITANTVASTVRTDKESYENGDALGAPPVLPPVVTPEAEREEKGTGVLDLPPISKNMIPESSLPIGAEGAGTFDGNPLIQSVGPQSTTAQLAAQVPLEPKPTEPEAVKESQESAGVDPEVSAVPEEVHTKSAVEEELPSAVPEAPVTSNDTAVAAKDEVVEVTRLGGSDANGAVAPAVPEFVKESIVESGQSPEAAAYSEPIEEKKAVEKELLSEVKPEDSTGEPAPKIADSAAALSPPETPKEPESRDISPTTVPDSHTQTVPSITTDKTSTVPETSTTPATPATPSSSKAVDGQSPASPVATEKKKKRLSIFGKLKEKFSDKHKDKN